MRIAAALALAAAPVAAAELPLEDIELPPGFSISIYADDVRNARAMAWGDDGTLFVGTREEGKVYAVRDDDGDGRAESVRTIAKGLRMPVGVAFRDGDLYVSAVERIVRFDDIESKLDSPGEPVVAIDGLPPERHHGWRYIAFGPDGKLYVPIGAPCNVCEEEGFATIERMNADGSGREVIARGVRNSVGFDWHPGTGAFWFTENGRDWMGDDRPDCELNVLHEVGEHFGFPYCHADGVRDPEFGEGHDCADYTAPVATLGPHVAPLGMRFYTGSQFPPEYRNAAFIAEHGSWNRSQKIGYRVTMVKLDGERVVDQRVFAQGWLDGQRSWGRPVDVIVAPDGALLVSDDYAGVIYAIRHDESTDATEDEA